MDLISSVVPLLEAYQTKLASTESELEHA
jgi:hypothetical protein